MLCERAYEKSNLDCGDRRTVDVGVFLLGQPSACRNLGGSADVGLAYRGGIRACQHARSGGTGERVTRKRGTIPAPSPTIVDEARADEFKVANWKIYNDVSTGSEKSKFQYLKPFSKEWKTTPRGRRPTAESCHDHLSVLNSCFTEWRQCALSTDHFG